MTLHQLRVYSVVIELGGVNKAARRLKLTQPSVSLVLKALEDSVGSKLHERIGNGKIQPTAIGLRVYEFAKELAPRMDKLRTDIDELRGLRKGSLAIGGSAIAAASFLPQCVQKFKRLHDGVDVILKIDTSNNIEKMLLDGTLDLALLGRAPNSPTLTHEVYRKEKIVAIAPPDHPLAKKRSVPLKLVAKEPIVVHAKGNSTRDIIERGFTEKGIPFKPTLEMEREAASRETIKTMVGAGFAIGFLTFCNVVWDIKAGRFKLLNIPELQLTRTIHLTIHKSRSGAHLVQAFKNFLRTFKE